MDCVGTPHRQQHRQAAGAPSAIEDQALKNDAAPRHERVRNSLWIVLVASSTVLASLVLACAAPLSGVATFAGTKMRFTAGCIAVGLAWLANQLVGFVMLDYPQTWDNFGWGIVMGIASALAFLGAAAVSRTGMRDVGNDGNRVCCIFSHSV